MKRSFFRSFVAVILAVLMLGTVVTVPSEVAEAASSTKIYYNIDFSAAVLKSRINQKVSADCAVVSMATIEAYLYGATSDSAKNTVYNAVVSKNGDDNYAYWSNVGYVSKSSISWADVYTQISKGYPCIIHRNTSAGEHWAVVAGYKGSTTTLESGKFVVVDVYRGTGGQDIYTSAAWKKDGTINRMTYRKNGLALTSFSGIKFAVNHPSVIHKNGEGHGVYGYVTSNTNLTSVNVKVTNLSTGTVVYNKTVTPNAKSYLVYNLDSEMNFAKWANGQYYYTIEAKTAGSRNLYNQYFQIASSWPTANPSPVYTFKYNANGGTGSMASFTIGINSVKALEANSFTHASGVFNGWNIQRNDGKWYCTDGAWHTDSEIAAKGYTKKLYEDKASVGTTGWWLMNGTSLAKTFTAYAQWKMDAFSDPSPDFPDFPDFPDIPVVGDKKHGDVNDDGNITPLDASLVLQYNAKLINSLENTAAADVNMDGSVTALDASLILQYNAKLITEFPIAK